MNVTGETQLGTLVFGSGELSMATSSTRFSSSTGTYPLTATDLCDNNIITVEDWDGNTSSTMRLQLPTATTLFADCLGVLAKTKTFLFRNEGSNHGSSTLIVAGTNIVLTSSTPSVVTIPGGASARIQMWRLNTTATSSGVQVNVAGQSDAD